MKDIDNLQKRSRKLGTSLKLWVLLALRVSRTTVPCDIGLANYCSYLH